MSEDVSKPLTLHAEGPGIPVLGVAGEDARALVMAGDRGNTLCRAHQHTLDWPSELGGGWHCIAAVGGWGEPTSIIGAVLLGAFADTASVPGVYRHDVVQTRVLLSPVEVAVMEDELWVVGDEDLGQLLPIVYPDHPDAHRSVYGDGRPSDPQKIRDQWKASRDGWTGD